MNIFKVMDCGVRRKVKLILQFNPYPTYRIPSRSFMRRPTRCRYYSLQISSKLHWLTYDDIERARIRGPWIGYAGSQALVILVSTPVTWGDLALDDLNAMFPGVTWSRRILPRPHPYKTLSYKIGIGPDEFDWLVNHNRKVVAKKMEISAEAVSVWSGTGTIGFDVKMLVIYRFPTTQRGTTDA
jgi:hypothetical protein